MLRASHVVLSLVALGSTGCGAKSELIVPPRRECACGVDPVCLYAGNGEIGFDGDGRRLRESSFYWPVDLEFAPSGQAFIVDFQNHRIRRVSAAGTLETILGIDIPGDGDSTFADLVPPGVAGTTVAINHPTDLVFAPDGALFVASLANAKIRRWDPSTALARVVSGRGRGFAGDGGPADRGLLGRPVKMAFDARGNLFFVDQENLRVREIDADGVLSTVVGRGEEGDGGGEGVAALDATLRLARGENPEPEGAIAVDSRGDVFFADTGNHRVRVLHRASMTITTLVNIDGVAGSSGDGDSARNARIDSPRDLEFGPDGDLYIADTASHCVRAVSPSTGVIRTVLGRCGEWGSTLDWRHVDDTRLYRPFGIAFDPRGTLYVADTYNSRIVCAERR